MLEARDLVNPTFNYEPRFNKPVLSYWIVAALYKMFGESVGVQRFGIALGALIIIGAAYVLAALPRDRTSEVGPRASGLWAAAGLAAAPRLVMFARRIFIDIWLTAFMALTLTFFALSEAQPERRRRWLLLMYASIGLGVLTKGPVAVALPGMAFALYLIVRREIGRVREMMLPSGAAVIAAIVVPWYAALYHQHGWTYIRSFLLTENVERFTAGVGVGLHRGPEYYLPVVFSDSFPWSLLLPMAAVMAWRSRPAHRGLGEGGSRLDTLLWCWIGSIVVFFSFSAAKQDLYIFPIVPAVAALGGRAIAAGLSDERWRSWLSSTLAIAGALLAVAGGAVLYLFQTAGRVYALDAALLIGVIAAGHAGARRDAASRRRGIDTRRGDDRRQLGVRAARAARVRALQAGAGLQPSAREPAAARRRRRALPHVAAEHGLLPAPARRSILRRALVRGGDSRPDARVCGAVRRRLSGARAAHRRPHVHRRSPSDVRREAGERPRAGAVAGVVAHYQSVSIVTHVLIRRTPSAQRSLNASLRPLRPLREHVRDRRGESA
jgi:4-amino-4-deoxy-L-arabinose transferase-like glycosyltransferase